MPHDYELRESANEKIEKLDGFEKKKVMNKILQICENPSHFKPLRSPMDGYRRVHVNTSYVIIFSINPLEKKVIIEDYEHHDKVYK